MPAFCMFSRERADLEEYFQADIKAKIIHLSMRLKRPQRFCLL